LRENTNSVYPHEDFLHYIWQNGYFSQENLRTSAGEKVEIVFPGFKNSGGGPDFTEAKIRIGDQIWFGNVELHTRSSQWYAHHHEKDPAYDSVILHVVWEEDMPVFNRHGAPVPALEIKNYVFPEIKENYARFHHQTHRLKCRPFMPIDRMVWVKWLERLYAERMENKTRSLIALAEKLTRDWEDVLFRLLLRYFGMKDNTDAFEAIADATGFKIFRKYLRDLPVLEALLLGTAGLLENAPETDSYVSELKRHYAFLKAKHRLRPSPLPVKHGGMRPGNFPSIRLAQFARLYHTRPDLFDKIMQAKNTADLEKIFRISTSEYWQTHYLPGKESKKRPKYTGKNFIRSLILNTVIPLRHAYHTYRGQEEKAMDDLQLAAMLPPETNRITRMFEVLRVPAEHAAASQGLLQLYGSYCSRNNCLNCDIGKYVLSRENHR